MIKRSLTKTIKEHLNYFPVIALLGPRQSGKSTLVKEALPEYKYINLEVPTNYQRATDDPEGFITDCPQNTIIDEAQLVPELFSAIQVRVDANQINGEFILAGSHNFLLLKNIKQSLAGRISLLTLLPFSVSELSAQLNSTELKNSPKVVGTSNNKNKSNKIDTRTTINNIIFNGSYPRLYVNQIPKNVFFGNYLKTYITRDVQGFLDVRNIETFNKLLVLLAHDAGALINFSRYSNDLQVDIRTIKAWINILSASYVIYLMPAYYVNARKRAIKTHKIYFYDTGLLTFLEKIASVEQMIENKHFGNIYENFIIVEQLKQHLNNAEDTSLYFYRDKDKREFDMIDMVENKPDVVEIKSTMTYKKDHKKHLLRSEDLLGIKSMNKKIIYRGESTFTIDDIKIISEKDWFHF